MLDRKSAPAFSPLTNFQLPTPEVVTLTNGCKLVCLNAVKQDVIKIELLFKSGKWFESVPGTAHFTAQLLDKGISGKTAYQIATWFDLYGASVEINAGLDFTSASLYSLASTVHETLPLFFQLVTEPAFPENELTQAKDIFIQNLKLNLEKSSFVASRNIRKNIFGESHPYGSILNDTHLNTLTTDSLKEYFKATFHPYEVYVTGQLSESISNKLIRGLSEINSMATLQTRHFLVNSRDQYEHVEKTESTQTSLRLGKLSINRTDPEYPQIILLNHILGGYFGSRLMKNLREERGLTYGIHSSVSTFANDSVFMIGTDVNKQDCALAIDEIKREISLLCTEHVSDSELALARNHLLGSIQLDAANPFSIMDKIKMLRTYGLSTEYYNLLFNSIMNANSADLKKLAVKHFNLENLHVVAVG